jgi:DNA-binding NarL/FixJ family response regulator
MNPVLIADADPAARKALMLVLRHRLGVEQVSEAADVQSLICAMSKSPPGLLLLDWRLYGAPAPETCRLLQKAYPSLKIVLLSPNADDAEVAREAGAGFIYKGASPDQLVATLAPLLQD